MEGTEELKNAQNGGLQPPKDGSIKGFESLHRLLEASLSPEIFQEVSRLLIGLNCGRPLERIGYPDLAKNLSLTHDFDLQAFRFHAEKEDMRQSRIVRVGLIQNSIVLPTTAPFADQKKAIMEKLRPLIDAAGASGVNILCLQEAWMMPFAFCTREKQWCEFAEPIYGESTAFLQELARNHNMVIVSPILERDVKHGETIWNTAVIIGNHGNIIGKHRKARNAAIANSFFVGSINRVGTEVFPNPFTSGDGKPEHRDFGHFYGSSHFSAPDASCSPSLSRCKDGLLVADMDLNLCRQLKDKWGFRMTARYQMYANLLRQYLKPGFIPQVIIDPLLQ
ncbi:beta-ureidopropionase isoform X2 [Wolffia australiana]